LKNFSRSIILKLAALVLLCCLLPAVFQNGLALAERYDTYGSLLLGRDAPPFTGTTAFLQETSRMLNCLSDLSGLYVSEAAVKDGSAWAAREQLLRDAFEEEHPPEEGQPSEFYKEIVSRFGEDPYYEDFWPEGVSDPYEGESGDSYPEEPATSYNDYNRFYAEKERLAEYVRAKRELEDYIRSEKNGFLPRYQYVTDYLGGLKNMRYVLVNVQTGTVYSNLTTKSKPDAATLQAQIKAQDWFLYQNGAVDRDGTEQALASYNYRPWLFDPLFNSNQKFDIYLGFDPEVPEADVFQPLKEAYEEQLGVADAQFYSTAIAGLAVLLLVLYLVAVSGRKRGREEVRLAFVDKLFNDLHLAASAALILGGLALVLEFSSYWNWGDSLTTEQRLFAFTLLTAACLAALEWLLSAARHGKNKTLFRHTLIAFLFRQGKRVYTWLRERIFQRVPGHRMITPLLLLTIFVCLIINFALTASLLKYYYNEGLYAFLLVVFNLAVSAVLLYLAVSLRRLMEAVSQIRQGNYNLQLNPNTIIWFLRDFARDILAVQEGLHRAVDSALRDQRMKTELITNVSHDLKTPLTSIISYVDLLKRCELGDETALEYLAVLDEKSLRLKNLVENLVEASKATSGSVDLLPVPINLNELALQAAGENADAFSGLDIELRVTVPEQPVVVYADSQKTWRILENLLDNVRKYAMPGTRVFLSVEREAICGVFTMKNTSRYPIDVPAEELLQRFVRGDAARAGEGSGLGLSIASSLSELQGGQFSIAVDGDLFKVTLRLPLEEGGQVREPNDKPLSGGWNPETPPNGTQEGRWQLPWRGGRPRLGGQNLQQPPASNLPWPPPEWSSFRR